MEFDITGYGADPSGQKPSTVALQAALDAAAAAGGGTVVVPPGTYVSGTIYLRSHCRLHLELGSRLVASTDSADYQEESVGHIPPEFPYVCCLLIGFDIHDFEMTGGGVIDGSGRAFMDYETPTFPEPFTKEVYEALPEHRRHEYVCEHSAWRPTWVMYFRGCRDLRFRDVRVEDAFRWTLRFSRCTAISVRGLHIDNELRAPNGDGLHFTSCRDVTISDCVISSGDDAIAVTSYGDTDQPGAGVVITNCILTSHSAGLRIGLHDGGHLSDIAVSNCLFRACNRGVGVFSGPDGSIRHVALTNLRIETRLVAGSWWGKAEPVEIASLGLGGLIEDVAIRDLSIDSEQGMVVYGQEGSTIRDIRLREIRMRLRSSEMGPHFGGTIDILPRKIFRRPVPPVLVHRAEDVTIRDVAVTFERTAGPYFTAGPILENASRVHVAGYTEQDNRAGPPEAVV
jgi:polygalacturonase